HRDVTRAVAKLALRGQGIGGGTRIGESLATFNRWHARRVINSRTAVMIVSDGYDTGEPERLAAEMRRLRRRCRRIIWLNPLFGRPDHTPRPPPHPPPPPPLPRSPPPPIRAGRRRPTPIAPRIGFQAAGGRYPRPHPEPQGGGRAVRACHRGAHRGGDRGKSRRQGGDPAGRHHLGGLDRRRLRPRGGAQGGARRARRRPLAPRLGAAAPPARPAGRVVGRGGPRPARLPPYVPPPEPA